MTDVSTTTRHVITEGDIVGVLITGPKLRPHLESLRSRDYSRGDRFFVAQFDQIRAVLDQAEQIANETRLPDPVDATEAED